MSEFADYMKNLQEERESRYMRNMQTHILPYLKQLYQIKGEEENRKIINKQKELERIDKYQFENYKESIRTGNDMALYKEKEKINKENDINLLKEKNVIDQDNMRLRSNLDLQNDIILEGVKQEKKNQESKEENQKKFSYYKDLYENGRIDIKEKNETNPKKNGDGKIQKIKVFTYRGKEYPFDSKIAQEYQNSVLKFRELNVRENKLDDLMHDINKNRDVNSLKELMSLYYFERNGKYQSVVQTLNDPDIIQGIYEDYGNLDEFTLLKSYFRDLGKRYKLQRLPRQ